MNKPLSEIFRIEYPKTLVFGEQSLVPGGVPFVSSSAEHNGIAGYVERRKDLKLYPAGAITIPLKGSVLHAFYQASDFYVAHQIAVLYPKRKMKEQELFYYVLCIRKNKYRFSYGRQADRTLRNIEVPSEVPRSLIMFPIRYPNRAPASRNVISIRMDVWRWFALSEIFDIKKGKRLTKEDMRPGATPFIGSTELDNGVTAYVDEAPIHKGNTISVTYNGSVAEAFYQPRDFWATDDVNVLYPKFALNPYRALFLCAIIRKEKYRYNYGRKWHLERMRETKIKLPVDKSGQPDWEFMEAYIKSLPYSGGITE